MLHLWQVCGVFVLLLAGAYPLLWWGFACAPGFRQGFLAAYYAAATACVVAGLTARSSTERALPMLALVGIRIAAIATRIAVEPGPHTAVWHYAAMEVRAIAGSVAPIATALM